jgi:hypothetical protein
MLATIKHVFDDREYLVAHQLTPPLHGFNLLFQMSGSNGVSQIPVQEVDSARRHAEPRTYGKNSRCWNSLPGH